MIQRFLYILIVILLSGCAKLAHLEQLLTLKRYSENAEVQHAYVKAQNEGFKRMCAAAEDGTIEEFTTKKSILEAFGDPVFTRQEEKGGQQYEMWLYRYATKYFHSKKIYLYFDAEGQLKDWEYYIPPEKKDEKEV